MDRDLKAYEKLGAFYLGRMYDPVGEAPTGGLVLYDSKDLTTHAVVLGMTGSGKTGLSIALLEEAALDGVPAIVIDPKGDLANLLLTFPDLSSESFLPWVDPAAAAREGVSVDAYAERTARNWRDGLMAWEQEPDRIRRMRDAVEFSLYTPGSTAGMPLRLLRSFVPPPAQILADAELLLDRVTGAVSGLLSLIGIDADPVRDREHVLLSNLLHHGWSQGVELTLQELIRQVQAPPFEKIGVLDLESIFPAKERLQLAIALNNLIASPSFSVWSEGDPLDIGRLLSTGEGKPRISILSIAHLTDQERMFFVTLLLNEMVGWMRTQPGTTSLRAILYMDEIFGFFPPTQNPPSKKPMLTLLKQARAFGIGVVLATQNPVDLDYKGLANTGTWFLGRLQTEQDRDRVLDGLTSASGGGIDRDSMAKLLAGLKNRCFVMQNAHEDGPVLLQTRWVMSYLRGPLTRLELEKIRDQQKEQRPPRLDRLDSGPEPAPKATTLPESRSDEEGESLFSTSPPVLPDGIRTLYLPAVEPPPSEGWLYRPLLVARARLHFIRTTDQVDTWQDRRILAGVAKHPWEASQGLKVSIDDLATSPDSAGRFEPLLPAASRSETWDAWKKDLASYLYRTATVDLFRCSDPKGCSRPDETEGEFRIRLAQRIRENRDDQVEKLRARFQPKIERLRERLAAAEAKAEREQEQYQQQKYQTAVSVGATVLGAIFGRRATTGNVGRAATAARGVGRIEQERKQVSRASADHERIATSLENLERSFQFEADLIRKGLPPDELKLEYAPLKTRKSDMQIDQLGILWTPWRESGDKTLTPAFDVNLLK